MSKTLPSRPKNSRDISFQRVEVFTYYHQPPSLLDQAYLKLNTTTDGYVCLNVGRRTDHSQTGWNPWACYLPEYGRNGSVLTVPKKK